MRFLREATGVQKLMAGLMAGVFVLLGVFLVPELAGVFSPELEDTFSEWVFDLPLPAVLGISAGFAAAGLGFVWAAGHFIEGFLRRRRIEKQDKG